MLCPGISRHAIAQAERDSVWNLSVRLKPTTGVFEFSESFKKIFVIKSWSLWWGAILWPEECAAPSVRFLPLLQNIHVILVILSHCLKATNFRSSDFTIHRSGGDDLIVIKQFVAYHWFVATEMICDQITGFILFSSDRSSYSDGGLLYVRATFWDCEHFCQYV